LNRVDRLHAILVHLQSKKKVTAQEIADRFDLSLRTVYRDVKALEESGIPIIGESGIGYSVMEGYRLPPVMFTQEEASSLLLGSKLVHQFTDTSVKKQFDSAMYKIKAVLRTTDKDFVEELDSRIAVHITPMPLDESLQLHLTAMRQAIVDKKVVHIEYYSTYKEETTLRDAEPIGLFYYGQTWHFIGWCRLRKDYRDFRMDRIRKLVLKDDRFDDAPHPSLTEYIAQLTQEREMLEAVVSFDKEMAKYMVSQKYYYGFVSQEEKDGRIYMRFLTAHFRSFCRWLLMYTNAARIESPAHLHSIMQELVEELKVYYK
jgi:predicted DNA-binding transcriptional regulator YafY